MIYCYSNVSKSKGVSDKVSRQVDLLKVAHDNIVELNKFNLFLLCIKYFAIRDKGRWYFREGLLVNIFILLTANMNFVLELNRPLSSIKGRRSKFILWVRRSILLNVLSKSGKIISISSEIHNSLPEAEKLKSMVFPNFFGFDFRGIEQHKKIKKKTYDLVIVADLEQPWQAKDFLEEYLIRFPSRTLVHIGKGTLNLPNVTSLGVIEDLSVLRSEIQTACVAISQLGLKRIGMVEATPLKHVDYVMSGFPIISGAMDILLDGVYPIYKLSKEDVEQLEAILVKIENSYQNVSLEELQKRVNYYEKQFYLACKS